jgi:molecular chaperone GrpE
MGGDSEALKETADQPGPGESGVAPVAVPAPAGTMGPPGTEGAGGAAVVADLAGLAQKLEQAQREAREHWDALLRTRAEMENQRKRLARDVENAQKYGLERFVAELLPVKDSLELGLAAAGEPGVDAEKVREGLDLTLRMLSNVFEKTGITEVDPKGARFDPERHQAMTVQDGTGAEPGTVTLVVQKGYLLNDRLVRPAMVIVAR